MQSKTTMLGLDFGASTLKWTLMERGSVKQAQELPLPENLTRDSHIGSVQMMGDTPEGFYPPEPCRPQALRGGSARRECDRAPPDHAVHDGGPAGFEPAV